ncbi:YggS family pyridoxal phosphate-dependent enzyme [Clostridium fallax]|uniref:Pyridoxal phosphate homeostasis protein n=1 Tax=Clostridium fallax TaxID=1533 RepID=A0A1M4YIK1_9CLOT|nr:YggS family pyridoxal phosphate-dependent enzyme [Clostridium fallax]SHF05664.1 hypothetical protein SAMN05443638_12821 [Clostridium fallax]SQB06308.1 alanine racemase domain-containing protein [Clostridium fallax]
MDIEDNISNILSTIPQDVTLIAVSKTKPIEDLKRAYAVGIRDFGENKVQELVEKCDSLDKDIRWHFIGNLQTNKVKYLVDRAYLIHSLDSIKLLNEIEKVYGKKNKVAEVLIEVNIGRELSKGGVLEENLNELLENVELCKFVKVRGLMAIIPKGDDKSCRLYFREVKKIWNTLKNKEIKNVKMEILSMGMTHDYKLAIEEGSNMVRIGEGIFGARNYNK